MFDNSYYDPIEAFERMREAGYMQSCPPASKNDSCDKKKKQSLKLRKRVMYRNVINAIKGIL